MRLGNKKRTGSFSYCARLSLYLNNIGCVSAIKKERVLFRIALDFHYICASVLNFRLICDKYGKV